MNNEFYEHKKSDAVKWIIVFVLIAVLIAGVVASLAVYNPQGSLTDILWNTETIREGSSEIWEYPFPENTHSGDTLKLFLWDAISLKPFVPYETVIIP